ncbi:GTPase IMAP family member 7 [Nibea albiflora]|uniref:GTPase IMAP family member 7 n=1 Tax=Nibea albiflora TaxID=240163 RepID=A0ACB7EVI5_NIBAL|nr:GTPase IMAP family member 7 [Nibea albiflora]
MSDWCIFCWAFSFACSLLVLLVEQFGLQARIPVSWTNFPITIACYAALLCLSASIIFPLYFIKNQNLYGERPQLSHHRHRLLLPGNRSLHGGAVKQKNRHLGKNWSWEKQPWLTPYLERKLVSRSTTTFNSGTRRCEAKTKSVNGRSITMIDTPGFFDTGISEEMLKPEIVRCITECAPGPHAFLICAKMETFTEHEQAVVNKINEYFSEEAFRYATVVFTQGDQLPEGHTIEDHVCQNKLVSDLVKKCGGRCHVIDNRYWNQSPNHEYRRQPVPRGGATEDNRQK